MPAKGVAKAASKGAAKGAAKKAAKGVAGTSTKGKPIQKKVFKKPAKQPEAQAETPAVPTPTGPTDEGDEAVLTAYERRKFKAAIEAGSDLGVKALNDHIMAMPWGSNKQCETRRLLQAYKKGGFPAVRHEFQNHTALKTEKACESGTTAVPKSIMIGYCGGNERVFQKGLEARPKQQKHGQMIFLAHARALAQLFHLCQAGEISEIKDPKDPTKCLYIFGHYSETSKATKASTSSTDTSLLDTLNLTFNFEATGRTELPDTRNTKPPAIEDATQEQKMWLKVDEACKAGQQLVFRAKKAQGLVADSVLASTLGQTLTEAQPMAQPRAQVLLSQCMRCFATRSAHGTALRIHVRP